MSLTPERVRQVAKLARLALDDDAIARMTTELEAIIGYVEQLQDVDTTDVEPIAQVTGLENVTRPDIAHDMLPVTEVLQNAPQQSGSTFLVPKVVER